MIFVIFVMFAIEFLQKLKEYNLSESQDKKNHLKSLYALAKENKEEFKVLLEKEEDNLQLKNLLQDLEQYEKEIDIVEVNDSEDDIVKLKKAFDIWEKEFSKVNEINDICINIVDDMINFYYNNKPHIFSTLLEIKQNENYELFKNHIKNSLRAKIAENIEKYYESEKYTKLNFFDKIKKKKNIKKTINKIVKYEFNFKERKEALELSLIHI